MLRRPSRRRILVAAASFGVIVFGWVTYARFYAPDVDDPRPVDAIVVLAGGGPRVDEGLALVDAGYADVVVFSSPFVVDQNVWAARPCNDGRPDVPAEVHCFEPHPGTTRGEVRYVAQLARARRWDSVLVVASTDQVSRARMLLERCWDGDALFVDVPHDQPRWRRAVYEWGATVKALTVTRSC